MALVYGPEELVEGRGLGYRDLRGPNPALVYARCRPSRTAAGTVEDFGLLVEARAGFCTQLAGHRPGPIFIDVRAPGGGAALLLLTSVLALLGRRARTGAGGWAETSLYDGMLATLGCMIGRSERAAPEIEGYWEKGSTFPNFLYRCADGELIQVWFGGKGMYAKLIEVLGDEPSAGGYYSDQMTGKLGARAARWTSFFATRPRGDWIRLLRAAGVACEPVLGPGELLADPHLAETGLAVRRAGRAATARSCSARPIAVRPLRRTPVRPLAPNEPSSPPRPPSPGRPEGGRLLGVRGRSARRAGPRRPRAPTSSRSSRPRARRCARPPTPWRRASGASAAWRWTSARRRPGPWSSGCWPGPTSSCTTSGSACPNGSASTRTRWPG